MKTRVFIDGTNLAHRYFHAVGNDRLRDNFAALLKAILGFWRPIETVVAFDDGGRTFRHELFPEYKAGRTRHDGTDKAIELALASCNDVGLRSASFATFEADDVIASLVDQTNRAGQRAVIVSADKDLHQLIRSGDVTQAIKTRREGQRVGADPYQVIQRTSPDSATAGTVDTAPRRSCCDHFRPLEILAPDERMIDLYPHLNERDLSEFVASRPPQSRSVTYEKDGHLFAWVFTAESRAEIIGGVSRLASDPTNPFGWSDAAFVIAQMRTCKFDGRSAA